jgi:hypothetical protein
MAPTRPVGMDEIEVQIILGDDETALWRRPHGDAAAARFRVELKRLGRHIHSHSGRRVEIRGRVERPDDGDHARDVLWRCP